MYKNKTKLTFQLHSFSLLFIFFSQKLHANGAHIVYECTKPYCLSFGIYNKIMLSLSTPITILRLQMFWSWNWQVEKEGEFVNLFPTVVLVLSSCDTWFQQLIDMSLNCGLKMLKNGGKWELKGLKGNLNKSLSL